jgi:hypothetical protein
MKENKISYIELSIQLHGCVEKNKEQILISEINTFLREKLNPDFASDIEVSIEEHTPLN